MRVVARGVVKAEPDGESEADDLAKEGHPGQRGEVRWS